MIQRVQDLALGYQEGRIEVQLVGGFTDAHSYSEDIFFSIMSKSVAGEVINYNQSGLFRFISQTSGRNWLNSSLSRRAKHYA